MLSAEQKHQLYLRSQPDVTLGCPSDEDWQRVLDKEDIDISIGFFNDIAIDLAYCVASKMRRDVSDIRGELMHAILQLRYAKIPSF